MRDLGAAAAAETQVPDPAPADTPLRRVSDGIFGFTLSVGASLVSQVVKESGLQRRRPGALRPTTPLDVCVFAMLVSFCTTMAAATFRPRFPTAAEFLNGVGVVATVLAFASLASIILQAWLLWVVYALCVVPLLPLFQNLYQWSSDQLTVPTSSVCRRFCGGTSDTRDPESGTSDT